jgi:hypothetical protein
MENNRDPQSRFHWNWYAALKESTQKCSLLQPKEKGSLRAQHRREVLNTLFEVVQIEFDVLTGQRGRFPNNSVLGIILTSYLDPDSFTVNAPLNIPAFPEKKIHENTFRPIYPSFQRTRSAAACSDISDMANREPPLMAHEIEKSIVVNEPLHTSIDHDVLPINIVDEGSNAGVLKQKPLHKDTSLDTAYSLGSHHNASLAWNGNGEAMSIFSKEPLTSVSQYQETASRELNQERASIPGLTQIISSSTHTNPGPPMENQFSSEITATLDDLAVLQRPDIRQFGASLPSQSPFVEPHVHAMSLIPYEAKPALPAKRAYPFMPVDDWPANKAQRLSLQMYSPHVHEQDSIYDCLTSGSVQPWLYPTSMERWTEDSKCLHHRLGNGETCNDGPNPLKSLYHPFHTDAMDIDNAPWSPQIMKYLTVPNFSSRGSALTADHKPNLNKANERP